MLLVIEFVFVGGVLLVGCFFWSWMVLLIKLVFLLLEYFFILMLDVVDMNMIVFVMC